jgi:GMP synthase-like glutamine amidotransferase
VRVLLLEHQRDAGAGVFAPALQDAGAELETWLIAGEPHPPGEPAGYDAVLSFGGATHPDQDDQHPWLGQERALLADLVGRGVPVLGVCLGAELLAEAAGATASRAATPEIGWYQVELTAAGRADPLLGPLAPSFTALEWHSYEFSLPPGGVALASSAGCLQAFRLGASAWGIQFHAEVTGEDFDAWIDDYASDPDALATGLDPHALRAQTKDSIAAWNELGRALARRFVATVS